MVVSWWFTMIESKKNTLYNPSFYIAFDRWTPPFNTRFRRASNHLNMVGWRFLVPAVFFWSWEINGGGHLFEDDDVIQFVWGYFTNLFGVNRSCFWSHFKLTRWYDTVLLLLNWWKQYLEMIFEGDDHTNEEMIRWFIRMNLWYSRCFFVKCLIGVLKQTNMFPIENDGFWKILTTFFRWVLSIPWFHGPTSSSSSSTKVLTKKNQGQLEGKKSYLGDLLTMTSWWFRPSWKY